MFPPGEYILDGELVILGSDGTEEFDALQNRLHPAESRVQMLAEQTPAVFRSFDVLAVGGKPALESPLRERRGAREADRLVEGPGQRGAHTVHRGSRRGRAVAEGGKA